MADLMQNNQIRQQQQQQQQEQQQQQNNTNSNNTILCNDCKSELIQKTTTTAETPQCDSTTTIYGYCLKCNKNQKLDNNKNNKKIYVLIETNNDEECNQALGVIKSQFPSANVNICDNNNKSNSMAATKPKTPIIETTSSPAAAATTTTPKSNASKLNMRYLHSNNRYLLGSSGSGSSSSIGSLDAPSTSTHRSSSLSLNNDGSMERQESRDSGFCSLSNSSFESMKSLSLNDTHVTTQLNVPGSSVANVNHNNSEQQTTDHRSNRRKWKKEHAWRYTNSSIKSNVDDNEPISKPLSECIIESIDESNEMNDSNRNICKDSSIDISLDTLNTNDNDPQSAQSTENNNKGPKRRGKLIREPTIDDEVSIQASSPHNNHNSDATSSQNEKDDKNLNESYKVASKKISSFHGRVSPPEKRASFIEKQMSIDESYPNNEFELNEASAAAVTNSAAAAASNLANFNEFEKAAILNRIRATNYNKKINNKYERHDFYRNLARNPLNEEQQSTKTTNALSPSTRQRIPIVRVQPFTDFENEEDHEQQHDKEEQKQQHQQKQEQQEKEQKNQQQQQKQAPSPSPTLKEKNIIEHSKHSLDEALKTIKQHQQQEKAAAKQLHSFSTTLYPTPTGSQHGSSLKLAQKHSLDLDKAHHGGSTANTVPSMFDPKLSLSSSSLLTSNTPPILFTQSASLDRYNYHPNEFKAFPRKPPQQQQQQQNELEATTNRFLNTKMYPFDQHRFSEPMIKIDQKELLEKLNNAAAAAANNTDTASSSPSVSPSPFNNHLFLQRANEAAAVVAAAAAAAAAGSNPHIPFYSQLDQQQQYHTTNPHHAAAAAALAARHHQQQQHLHYQNALQHQQQQQQQQQQHHHLPFYQLHQQNAASSLSTSTPSINTLNKTNESQHHHQIHKQESFSPPSSSPKPTTLLKHAGAGGIFNQFLNPYFQSFNTTAAAKQLQTHGYPFQSYIQNNEILFNFTTNNSNNSSNHGSTSNLSSTAAASQQQQQQYTMPQLGNYKNNNENDFQRLKYKSENSMLMSKEAIDQARLNIFSPTRTIKRPTNEVNKPHICTFCQKKFARSDMLIRHTRLHSGVRPYKCNQCGQEFSRSDHLNTHQRTHTGEKPYKCPYPKCTYAACRKDMITRHLKVHNKNRSPSTTTLLTHNNSNSSTSNLAACTIDTTSRHTSTSSPSSLSLSVSSPPPHFSLSLTSPLMNLEIASDQESQSTTSTNVNNTTTATTTTPTNDNDNFNINENSNSQESGS